MTTTDERGPLPDCIFCGEPGGSNEHAWPEWLRRYAISLVQPQDQYEVTHLDQERERLDREANIVVQCICDKCNRGWMRKLETMASPFLKQMMTGATYTLNRGESFTLRRWAIKTAATFEGHFGALHVSHGLRQSLRLGESPRGAAVLMGHYVGRDLLRHTRTTFTDPLNDDAFLTWVTLILGQVVLYVFTDFDLRHKQATLTAQAAKNFTQLPPGRGIKVVWPPTDPINDDLVDLLAKGPNRQMRDAPAPPG